jgi:hypothetical protein
MPFPIWREATVPFVCVTSGNKNAQGPRHLQAQFAIQAYCTLLRLPPPGLASSSYRTIFRRVPVPQNTNTSSGHYSCILSQQDRIHLYAHKVVYHSQLLALVTRQISYAQRLLGNSSLSHSTVVTAKCMIMIVNQTVTLHSGSSPDTRKRIVFFGLGLFKNTFHGEHCVHISDSPTRNFD